MKFVISAAEATRRELAALNQKPAAEVRAANPIATYESIKAEIDAGISRQSEGRRQVSEALKKMVSTKAYREKYKSIAAFAENEYGKSAKWIYDQLKAELPENECEKGLSAVEEARESVTTLHDAADLPAEQEKETLSISVASRPSKPEPIKDTTDHPIPEHLIKTWERRQEVQDLMTLASKLKSAIESIAETKDPLFRAAINAATFVANINAMHYQLALCKPDVICPSCNGDLKDDMGRECRVCRLTGFISERQWTTFQHSTDLGNMAKVEARNGSTRLPI